MRDIFVLSGGGSRGAAQVGMLRALLGAGIVPDVLVGGSVGAVNAVALAPSPDLERVEWLADRWRAMTTRTLTGSRLAAVGNLARRRPAVFSDAPLRALLGGWVGGGLGLEELPVRTRIATTELGTGRLSWHDSGPAQDVVLASAALPAVFPPVRLASPGGHGWHVDAGIAANMPWAAAFDLARPGDRIWGLDVTKRTALRSLRHPLDVLVASLVAAVNNQVMPPVPTGVDVVHLHLDASYDCGHVFDFSHTGELFLLGEQCATRALVSSQAA